MQIGTSLFFDRTSSQMTNLSAQTSTLNTQIATGKKLSAPSQDVVAYNRLASIKQATADQAAYAGNTSLAKSLLQQSDSTLTQVSTQLQRASELTLRANTGTLNDGDRKTIAVELKSILDDLVNLANTSDARGQPLFGAATGTKAVVQGADGRVTLGGTGELPAIPVGGGPAGAAVTSRRRQAARRTSLPYCPITSPRSTRAGTSRMPRPPRSTD
jgi:flagellar hook-associated protein 3 FlgL